MAELMIDNIRAVLPDGQILPGRIEIKDGKIIRILQEPIKDFKGEVIDGRNLLALPGFIDIHIHGANGADFMDGNSSAAVKIAAFLPEEGTTSFLATTLTQPPEKILQAIQSCREFMQRNSPDTGAEMLGFHLEGPFINPERAGAQPAEWITAPSIELLNDWFGEGLKDLKVVTLAPEKDEQYQLTKYLTKLGVITSAGHTSASFREITEAADSGLSHLTHFGNAMSGLHHREIGVVGAGLLNGKLFCEVIADGVHLSEDMLKLVNVKIGAERLILVTDSMRAKGLPDGSYTLAGQQVNVSGQKAVLEGGRLAGSVLKMDKAVQKMQKVSGASLLDIMKMSSMNAAQRLGVYDRKGSLEAGKDADIVLVDEEFNLHATFCRGKLSYTRNPI